MGCYLYESRLWVGTWTGKFLCSGVSRRGETNGTTHDCLGLTVLISVDLTLLLMIGGTENNPGAVVEVENTMQHLCTGCGKNLKS